MADIRFSNWIAYQHPRFGVVIQGTPGDTPQTMRAAVRALRTIDGDAPALPAEVGDTVEDGLDRSDAEPALLDREAKAAATGAPAAPAGTALQASGTAVNPRAAVLLSDAIDTFREHKQRTEDWCSAYTWTNAYAPDLALFRELVATEKLPLPGRDEAAWNIRMGDITRDHISRVVRDIFVYPERQGRRLGKDAKTVLAAGGAPQKAANAKKKLRRIKTFLDWAHRGDYCALDLLQELKNSMGRGRTRQHDVDGRACEGYLPFSDSELRTIFDAEPYRTDGFDRAWRHFAPMMALAMGLRVREIADLTPADFIVEDDIPCVWVRGGAVTERDGTVRTKRPKTSASVRKVPVPSRLIDAGLLEHVEGRRAAGAAWVWGGLSWEEKSGRGRSITRWFGEFRKDLGIKNPGKVFHSFRTNFNNAISNTALGDVDIEQLLGHAPKSIRGKHYSRGADGEPARRIPALLAALNAMDFGEATFHRSRKWAGKPQHSCSRRSPMAMGDVDGRDRRV